MQRRSLLLLAGTVLAAAVLTAGATARTTHHAKTAAPKPGGTLVFGAEQEPGCWNSALSDCELFWTQLLTQTELQGAYQEYPDLSLHKQLITDAVVTTKPFTVTFTIDPKATWNDGVPVTADDFIFTWKTYVNPKNNVNSREGFNLITKAQKFGSKKVKFFFKAPYARWEYLWIPVFPAHAIQGADFNTVWNNGIVNPKNGKPISDGPYLFTKWEQGAQLTLTRNPKYWGWSPSGKSHQSYINTIIFRFITDTNSEIQAMKSGEVDAIYPQPQLALADLRSQAGLHIQSGAGPVLEGLTWNLSVAKGGPLMSAPWVRQALMYSIDRAGLVKQLFATLKPDLKPLNSNIYVQTQKDYKPFFNIYSYSVAKVNSIMTAHGCTKGGDGIWVCKGNRMSYNFGTTAGNKLRELAFEIMQAQAKGAGFEFKAAFQPAGVFFSDGGVFGGNFQIALYADVASGDPGDFTTSFECKGPSNYADFCSAKVTAALKAADQELDPQKRADLVNTAVKLMSINDPRFPLYQKPTFLVYKDKLHGLIENPSVAGPTWNVMDWYLS